MPAISQAKAGEISLRGEMAIAPADDAYCQRTRKSSPTGGTTGLPWPGNGRDQRSFPALLPPGDTRGGNDSEEAASVSENQTSDPGSRPLRILSPEEIAAVVGGISVKSLTELLRKNQLETTTLGHAAPSRRGGPPRRLWGMTEEQLRALIAFRERQARRRRSAERWD
jgi:hypothetical protein